MSTANPSSTTTSSAGAAGESKAFSVALHAQLVFCTPDFAFPDGLVCDDPGWHAPTPLRHVLTRLADPGVASTWFGWNPIERAFNSVKIGPQFAQAGRQIGRFQARRVQIGSSLMEIEML